MGDATTAPPHTPNVSHSIIHSNLPDYSIREDLHSSMNLLGSILEEDRVNFVELSNSGDNVKRKGLSTNDQVLHRLDYIQNIESSKESCASVLEKEYPNKKDIQECHHHIEQEKSCSMVSHEVSCPVVQVAANDSANDSINLVEHHLSYGYQNSRSEFTGIKGNLNETSSPVISKIKESKTNPQSPYSTEYGVCQTSDIVMSKTPSSEYSTSSNLSVKKNVPSLISEDAFKSISSTLNYPVNSWYHSPNSISTSCPPKSMLFTTPPVSISKMPLSCPERVDSSITKSSPRVRISLSLDGKAELTADYPSPSMQISRPKSASGNLFSQKKMDSRRRSQSLILPSSNSTGLAKLSSSSVPRRPIGRSRDARSWTFCCDGDCRDELTRLAENESHGSAVAAISLIRSAFNPIVKTSPNKRRASNSEPKLESAKKLRVKKESPGQTGFQDARAPSLSLNTPKDDCINYMITSPSGDSDKENWLPQLNGSPPRRLLPSSRLEKLPQARTILGDNETKNTNSVSLGSLKNCKRRLTNSLAEIYRDHTQIKACPESEKIGNCEVASSKIGDLGAIQGLLSLSKGNWR